jgi:hypothetical protein
VHALYTAGPQNSITNRAALEESMKGAGILVREFGGGSTIATTDFRALQTPAASRHGVAQGRWHHCRMDKGMTREEAGALAASVREACAHEVQVVEDGDYFAVQVTKRTNNRPDTFWLYDEADWAHLRERIAGP